MIRHSKPGVQSVLDVKYLDRPDSLDLNDKSNLARFNYNINSLSLFLCAIGSLCYSYYSWIDEELICYRICKEPSAVIKQMSSGGLLT